LKSALSELSPIRELGWEEPCRSSLAWNLDSKRFEALRGAKITRAWRLYD